MPVLFVVCYKKVRVFPKHYNYDHDDDCLMMRSLIASKENNNTALKFHECLFTKQKRIASDRSCRLALKLINLIEKNLINTSVMINTVWPAH